MKVFVTGGAGFIGSHTVDILQQKGYQPIIIDKNKSKYADSSIKAYQIDICDQNLKEIFKVELPDAVIHLAAQTSVSYSVSNPKIDGKINILGTINVLENCCKYGVKKIVFASSAAVYGEPKQAAIEEGDTKSPLSFYGLSKLSAEDYIKLFSEQYDLSYTILRYANVYGMRQDTAGEGGVIAVFINKLLHDETLTIYGDGNQSRDFIFVKDVAAANIAALSSVEKSILNISSNTKTTINELTAHLHKLTHKTIKTSYKAKKEGDITDSRLNNRRAIYTLNWQPHFSLEQGLNETIHYHYVKKHSNL
ncbi:NAD-dependent epimerase/dehydratase family protein [Bacillus taeanensis]|uniref:UDP-glucose 4-epimerase n=1 Tax=Bacillus taeanensis TaxID=273032 RepID=A0A366XVN7_9BACI|nr:NAD-dependent epimerase/dehydratase family protein [Bacillus taeanensis]RBW68011.1 UDP-glucose 4-epimerase [Bacillus taeanensis]